MNTSLKQVIWISLLVITILAIVAVWFQWQRGNDIQHAVADTRQILQQQGFKTDLDEFNFSTDAAARAREAALTTINTSLRFNASGNQPEFMPLVGSDAVIVTWKQDWLKTGYEDIHWPDLQEALDGNRWLLDDACAAALSGPIQFNLDASQGSAMLLRHLAPLRNLTLALSARELLELHNNNPDAAWTNLLAVTRLVTKWEPEPTEISQIVHFSLAGFAFNDTWQAMQYDGWPDAKLAELQHEWESVNYFTNMPETAAFRRASLVALCRQERQRPLTGGLPFADFVKEAFQSPASAYSYLKFIINQARYRSYGTFADERDLLLFFQSRERELRQAIQSPTWAEMRGMPGVTNRILFYSKYSSRLQSMINLGEMAIAAQRQSSSFLGRAAEAEAQRRILIIALALERYHGQHGAYPATLAALTPDFLKSVPMDFMDGQPLHYLLADDGHFTLYSVGLDGMDDGGKLPLHEYETRLRGGAILFEAPPQADIVWPLPASDESVAALRQREAREQMLEQKSQQQIDFAEEWKQSPLRQARTESILATNWEPDAGDMDVEGRLLNDYLRNEKFVGTNRLTLAELLTPIPVITGGEPEDLTFEVPIQYEALTNTGMLMLMVDADPEEPLTADSSGKMQEFSRAANGNCLLVWHTIYDPPGRHALQIQLTAATERGGVFCGKGPAIAVNTTNLCQFSLDSSTYSVERGATFHARLPETNGFYTIECLTTNGDHLATLTGSTTNGEFETIWDLVDKHGHRLNGETLNSIVHITLPDSGRTQTLRGP